MVTIMKKQSRGVDALIYLFDHMIADQLNIEYNMYCEIIESMTDEDSEPKIEFTVSE